jgi:hypothetical protein
LPTKSIPELLTGGSAGSATGLTVNGNGQVVLTGSSTQVDTNTGSITVSGTLDASNSASGQSGGTVQVLGNNVALVDRARVDVSGNAGGGTALIGGDYQGKGKVPNATQTLVESNVAINADAITSGNGGKVILWADEATRFYGNISARGGENAGDGGFVEVSGKENLAFDGSVEVGARVATGNGGQVLLDPASVVIGTDGTDDNQLDDGQILAIDPGTEPGNVFLISATRVRDILNTGNVTIAATQDITVNSDIDASGNAKTFDLALTASLINLNASITSKGGNITFNGPVLLGSSETISTGVGAGNITFNSTLNAVNGPQELTLTAGTGNITFGGAVGNGSTGSLSVTSTSAANLTANSTIVGDRINLTSGNITLNGDISTSGTAGNSVTLSATAGSLTTKNIITSVSSGDGGPVTLYATGNITTENINTKTSDDPDRQQGGSVNINTDGNVPVGNVAVKDITTTLGNVHIVGASIVTGKIDTSYFMFSGSDVGDVTLISNSGDIVVHSIKAQDDIDITASGLFRAVGTFKRPFTFIVVKDSPELINFFVSQGFNKEEVETSEQQVTIDSSSSVPLPISLVALSNIGSSIIIRHGGERGSDNGNLIQIYGGDSPPNFVIGPLDSPVAGNEFTYLSDQPDPAKPFSGSVYLQRNSPISTSLDQVPERFPTNVSGTAGGIVVGGGFNSVMNQALRNRPFEPTVPPPPPIEPPPPPPIKPPPPPPIDEPPPVQPVLPVLPSTSPGGGTGGGGGSADGSGSDRPQIATQVFQQQNERSPHNQERIADRCRKPQVTSETPTTEEKSDRSDEEDCEEQELLQQENSEPRLLRIELQLPPEADSQSDTSTVPKPSALELLTEGMWTMPQK